jgi:hypothetical protein
MVRTLNNARAKSQGYYKGPPHHLRPAQFVLVHSDKKGSRGRAAWSLSTNLKSQGRGAISRKERRSLTRGNERK